MFLPFLISSLFVLSKSDKSLSYDFQYTMGIPSANLYFPTENIYINGQLVTNMTFSLFDSKRDFIQTVPSNVLNERNITLTRKREAYVYKTDIEVFKKYLSNYKFLISKDDLFFEDEGIALGYKFEDDSYSIVHQLFNNKVIDHKNFAFQVNGRKEHGKLHLGGIANNTHLSFPYKGYCNVDDKYSSWGCTLTSITYNHTKYPIHSYAIFHSGYNSFIASNYLFQFMLDVMVKDAISKGICEEKLSVIFGKWVKCNDRFDINRYHTIDFLFGDMIVQFDIKELFIKDLSNNWYSSIVSNKNENSDDIILGFNFIKYFNYSLFDYDNKKVYLYSDNSRVDMLTGGRNIKIGLVKDIILVSVSICLVNILIISFHKYNKPNVKVLDCLNDI